MEDELVERARKGDVQAFSTLVEHHTPGLYAFLYRRVDNIQAVSDLTQETFLRAWRAVGMFRGDCSFRSWLYRIATHLAINDAMRANRQVPWPEHSDWADSAAVPAGELLEREEEHREVRAALQSLSQEDQEILRLLYQEQLSYTEISDLLGLPMGTVKVKLYRARMRLRTQLESMGGMTNERARKMS